ncbi:MAG: hypothetical protein AB2L24_02975 [Mangrovibacterium sp.]
MGLLIFYRAMDITEKNNLLFTLSVLICVIRINADMDKNENTEQDIIVSHFHDRADTEGDIPLFLRETNDYKETEKIFSLRKYITFLNSLSSEDQLWRTINRQINPGTLFLSWFKYAAIIILSFSFGALLIIFQGSVSMNPGWPASAVPGVKLPASHSLMVLLFGSIRKVQ